MAWQPMKHHSLYLDWYIHVPNIKHDLRSSGIMGFKYDLAIGEIDLSVNYAYGNPETAKLVAKRYGVKTENVFLSSDSASGQNSRIIRYLAESNKKKKEAVVEYPTYEPLLRQVQEYFPRVKRFERKVEDCYGLDPDSLRKVVSERTGLLVLTNPHAPSGVVTDRSELENVMAVARDYGFYVFCDEIYAEFDRKAIPTVFSIDEELGVVTTSFTKAYGLGGLRLGVVLANQKLVEDVYLDVLNMIGNFSNLVQLVAAELLARGMGDLERHKQKWASIKDRTEKWLQEMGLEYSPNKAGVTYWVETPIRDTHRWINDYAIPRFSLAPVPGAFFLFEQGYDLVKSNMVRLGLGAIDPSGVNLMEALDALEQSMHKYKSV